MEALRIGPYEEKRPSPRTLCGVHLERQQNGELTLLKVGRGSVFVFTIQSLGIFCHQVPLWKQKSASGEQPVIWVGRCQVT